MPRHRMSCSNRLLTRVIEIFVQKCRGQQFIERVWARHRKRLLRQAGFRAGSLDGSEELIGEDRLGVISHKRTTESRRARRKSDGVEILDLLCVFSSVLSVTPWFVSMSLAVKMATSM